MWLTGTLALSAGPMPNRRSRHLRPQTVNRMPIAERFLEARVATARLARGLSAEDCMVQSMPETSPVKWHLAHTTWFFETFLLERLETRFRPFRAQFRAMFNSYYQAVGPRHPRPARGVLSRPSLAEVADYRSDVEQRLLPLLERDQPPAIRALVHLGIAHEQQHQELILTDLLHHFSCNPLLPAYRERAAPAVPVHAPRPDPALRFVAFEGGLVEIGHDLSAGPDDFAFDNESPRHRVWLEPFALASRPVSQGEFARFIADGGYRRPELSLSDGWDLVQGEAWQHPIYWRSAPDSSAGASDGHWQVFGLEGLGDLDLRAPVSNLSYFEADAYARWAGARLPSEAEWEHAARRGELPQTGQVWEWTRSAYLPYPGFSPQPSAVGEYNGKFMINQMVLRGGSHATPPGHIRPSYRNFFAPSARWQFSGLRLARNP